MKIIMLDIDGVLNSSQEVYYHHRIREKHKFVWWFKGLLGEVYYKVWHNFLPYCALRRFSYHLYFRFLTDHYDFCPIACSNIQHVLDEVPEARIVVSSVWRHDGIKCLRYYMKRNGIDPSKVIDTTTWKEHKELCDCENKADCRAVRGHQIQEWLNAHPEVKDFIIIDDDADMGKLLPRLIQTDSRHGFLFKDAERAIKILKEGLYDDSNK